MSRIGRTVAYLSFWALRLQIAYLYADSAIAKMGVEDWQNGSAALLHRPRQIVWILRPSHSDMAVVIRPEPDHIGTYVGCHSDRTGDRAFHAPGCAVATSCVLARPGSAYADLFEHGPLQLLSGNGGSRSPHGNAGCGGPQPSAATIVPRPPDSTE